MNRRRFLSGAVSAVVGSSVLTKALSAVTAAQVLERSGNGLDW
jgi:hypothetical protein